jgi:lipoprotein-releasing system permease protein
VVVGVMALMVALGLMTGLKREIRSKILGATAHISIFRSGNEPFDNYRDVVTKVRKVPRVLGAAPTVYGKGLMMTAGGSAVATLKGVTAQERTVTDLASQVEEGQLEALDRVAEGSLPPVRLGRDLASTLGVGVGDVVSVTSPNGRLSPYGMVPSIKKFRVAGTVHSGLYEFDAQWAYIPLAVAQRLFTEGSDSASLVEVRIDDILRGQGSRAAS